MKIQWEVAAGNPNNTSTSVGVKLEQNNILQLSVFVPSVKMTS